jgi:glycosyltransferase involved in cell wall biosynthesis
LQTDEAAYKQWILENEPNQPALELQRKYQQKFKYRPLISILTSVCKTDEVLLEKMIRSVLEQTYSNWELCIFGGCSTKPQIRYLLEKHAALESRARVKFPDANSGISGNSSEAVNSTNGESIALLADGDELAPNALYENVLFLNNQPDADVIYSDEDKLNARGARCNPYFKPDWSPDFFFSSVYSGNVGIYRKSLVDKSGSFRPVFEGLQKNDLALRLIEHTNKIYHIPKNPLSRT